MTTYGSKQGQTSAVIDTLQYFPLTPRYFTLSRYVKTCFCQVVGKRTGVT